MTSPLAAAFFICALGVPAQAKPNMAKMPEAGPVRPYRAPARSEFVLSNGLRALLVEDHRFPLVTARLAVRAGAAALPAEDAGLAEAMARLLTEGAGAMTSKDIAAAADAVGGAVDASAAQDYVVVRGYCLSEHAERMLELLADVALRPAFPETEVELRKKNMLDELNINRSQPDFLAGAAFWKKLYAGHPYAVTAPTEASIARIDRARLAALHASLFTPEKAVFVLAGDLSPDKAREFLEKRFGAWKPEPPAPLAAVAEVEASSAARRVYLFDRPGSAQTALYVGNAALTEAHPDYFKLLLANQVLGGSFAARLMQDLREKKGYTYGIYSRLPAQLRGGAFLIRTQVRTEVTGEALKDIFGHLERIRMEKAAPAELQQAKNYLAGSFTRKLETQQGVADGLLRAILFDLGADYLDNYVRRVQAVTAEEALEAARARIRPDGLVVAVVGDAAKIREALAKFSSLPVRLVDVNGD